MSHETFEVDGVGEASASGRYRLDGDGRFVAVDDALLDLVGHPREALLGSHASLLFDGDPAAGKEASTRHLLLRRSGADPIACDVRVAPTDVGDDRGTAGVVGTATVPGPVGELRSPDGFVVVDADWRLTYVDEPAAELLSEPRDALRGRVVWDALPAGVASTARERFADAVDRQEPTTFEVHHDPLAARVSVRAAPFGSGLLASFRASRASEDEAGERTPERYETLIETVWDGIYALDSEGRFIHVNDAFCSMTGYEREELLGEPASLLHGRDVDSTAARLARDVAAGGREEATLELELRTASGGSIPVETRFGPYPTDDGTGRAGVVRDVSGRRERERKLERQREELGVLNDLNAVVRDLARAVFRQSTREEVERLVCDRLVGSDSYLLAWIGDVDRSGDRIRTRAEAGVDGYLDDATITLDGERSRGPTGRAIRTGEIQVTRGVTDDGDYVPWRDQATEHGYRASAAIPIRYEGTMYGVLNVYSARREAFGETERDVLGHLGDLIGHTINALERKRALISDDAIEIECRVQNVLDAFGVPAGDGTITFDRAIPVGDGTYLQYGTVTGGIEETLFELVDAVESIEEATVLDGGEEDDGSRFELRLAESSIVESVAAHGGRVTAASIEDGDYWMVIELPHGADVRAVLDTVRDRYPDTELVAQRRTSRESRPAQRLYEAFDGGITERQRSVLEAAYFAGFFEWPRKKNGEEVAASLGISAPTFHEHVRAGERKLLAALLDDPR